MSHTLGVTHSAGVLRGASLARRASAPQRPLSARAVPKRMMHSPTVYPGEDAPGTGLRHFPEDAVEDNLNSATAGRQQPGHAKQEREGHFQYKTTKQCYEEFPAMVHSSWPLNNICNVVTPSGLEEGPESGRRRRPGISEVDDRRRPRIPGETQSAEFLLRELHAKRGD